LRWQFRTWSDVCDLSRACGCHRLHATSPSSIQALPPSSGISLGLACKKTAADGREAVVCGNIKCQRNGKLPWTTTQKASLPEHCRRECGLHDEHRLFLLPIPSTYMYLMCPRQQVPSKPTTPPAPSSTPHSSFCIRWLCLLRLRTCGPNARAQVFHVP
ncbi:unnamed protein product, partial [Ectocarpus sp. 12 AP-2014]